MEEMHLSQAQSGSSNPAKAFKEQNKALLILYSFVSFCGMVESLERHESPSGSP